MTAWAVRFPRDFVSEASAFWNTQGVEVCDTPKGEFIWLRGADKNAETDAILRGFLSGKRYDVINGNQLKSPANWVPSGYLPDRPWIPLRDWLQLAFPITSETATVSDCLDLRLHRTTQESPLTLLLTDCGQWSSYAVAAASVRLQPLRFAVSDDNRVLVRGQPLPSIHGKRFAVQDEIAVAAGWTWQPAVSGGVLRRAWKLNPNDLVLLQPDRAPEVISEQDWVRATRSAARTSCHTNRLDANEATDDKSQEGQSGEHNDG